MSQAKYKAVNGHTHTHTHTHVDYLNWIFTFREGGELYTNIYRRIKLIYWNQLNNQRDIAKMYIKLCGGIRNGLKDQT